MANSTNSFKHRLDIYWQDRSLQKVQGHRTAQGHRAGVDVDMTPPTGGPVGQGTSPQYGDPV